MAQVKFTLDESEIPTHWYNVAADMPNPLRHLRWAPTASPWAPTHCRSSSRRGSSRRTRGRPRPCFSILSGHGHFDMSSYERYFKGELEDYEYPDDEIQAALARLPKVACV